VIAHAHVIGARLLLTGKDFGFTRMEGQWQYWGPWRYHAPLPALRGSYQLRNASGVLAALGELRDVIPVAVQDIKRGLLEVERAARLQVLPGRPAVVLDVAHNPHAARVLADGLGDMGFYQNTLAVFSMLKDKDVRGVIDAVKHRFDAWYLGGIESARAASVDWLEAQITELTAGAPVHSFSGVGAAYQRAWEAAGQNDRIVVFGSFLHRGRSPSSARAAAVNQRKKRPTTSIKTDQRRGTPAQSPRPAPTHRCDSSRRCHGSSNRWFSIRRRGRKERDFY
jgi:dihydrofolate synthase/folylpolyglutamate synthase